MNSDVYLPTEPDPEGRGLRGRRKGRVRFVRWEKLGAPSPFHLTGPHRRPAEVVCVAGESARMLPIKSSEVPPAPPLPALCPAHAVMAHTEALHEGYKRQPESKLCTPIGCSPAPAM